MSDIKDTLVDRQSIYGPPHVHFERTVTILNAMGFRRLGSHGEPYHLVDLDWPQIMIADKLARSMHDPTYVDNAHDISGYAECWKTIITGEKIDE